MKKLLSIFFILFCLLGNAVAETDDKVAETSKPKDGKVILGEFDVFAGFNKKRYTESDIRDKKPYAGMNATLSLKDTTFFGMEGESKYGINAEIGLNSFNTSNPLEIKEANFLISANKIGTRIFGLQKPVTSKMKVNSTSFAGENNGVSGNWQKFIRYPFLKSKDGVEETSSFFLTKPNMALESGIGSSAFLKASEDGTAFQSFEGEGETGIGLSYVGERKKGFRFGISFLPNNKQSFLLTKTNLTDAKGFQFLGDANDTYLTNIVATGINFYDNFDNFEVAFSFLYEHAGVYSENVTREDLNAYSIGLNLSYLGFTFGGSFANYGSSLKIKNNINTGLPVLVQGNNFVFDGQGVEESVNFSYIYDVGIGYSIDRYTLNLAYIQSRFAANYFTAGVLSFETKASKNLTNYFQIAKYQSTSANQFPEVGSSSKFSSFIFVLGIKYKF